MSKKPVSYLGGAVLIGTAIGAVVGLLATPLSGKEMRGALRKRALDAGKEIPERLKEVPGALRDLPGRGREALADLPERGRRTLSRLPGWATRKPRPDQPIDTTATEVRPDEAADRDGA